MVDNEEEVQTLLDYVTDLQEKGYRVHIDADTISEIQKYHHIDADTISEIQKYHNVSVNDIKQVINKTAKIQDAIKAGEDPVDAYARFNGR